MSITLHLGSCLDPAAGLPSKPRLCYDVTITDPPFEAEAHHQGRRVLSGTFAEKREAGGKRTVRPDVIDYAPMTNEERWAVAREIVRVTRRWIIIFCQIEAVHLWRQAIEDAGGEYVRTGVWVKTDRQPQYSGDRPGQGYEVIVICHGRRLPGGAAAALPLLAGAGIKEPEHIGKLRWNGGGHCAVWSGPSRDHKGDLKAKKLVKGQKPEWLIRKLIQQFSDPGETIVDPYGGAATTLAMADEEGRSAEGWELKPEHHARALARLAGTAAIEWTVEPEEKEEEVQNLQVCA